MDIADILRRALEAVEDADVPEPLANTAFGKAIDLYASGSSGPHSIGNGVTPALPARSEKDGRLNQIGAALGVPAEAVGDLYFEDGEQLGIGAASSSIDSKKAGGTKELALLVTAGRQCGGWEEWTSADVIRAVCAEYGRYDDSNFAATLQEMGDWFQVRGSRRSREFRLKRPGIEAAARLVRRITDTGQ